MGDEFDGCECIWTHEMAMQRLLNFVSFNCEICEKPSRLKFVIFFLFFIQIRQNQRECTDTYCIGSQRIIILIKKFLIIQISDRVQPNTPGGEDNNFTIMTMVMVFALIMYLIRPESVLKMTSTKRRGQGPNDGNGGSNQPPPPAPPAVNQFIVCKEFLNITYIRTYYNFFYTHLLTSGTNFFFFLTI